MRDFFKSRKGKLLLAGAAVLVGMIVFSARSGGIATWPQQALSLALYPFQKAAQVVTDAVSGWAGVFLNARENYEENIRLQEEVDSLQNQLARYQSLEQENERLREMLDIRQENPDLTLIDAAVIARDPSDFSAFTIDRGSLSGVSLYDPVITSAGLVGYVGEVSLTTARVVTLYSPDCNVGAAAADTGDSGNITGDLSLSREGLTRMELIPRDAELSAGSLLMTTGLTGSFPEGILIGEVVEVQMEESGISLWASVRPAADIEGASSVFVVTDFPGKGADEGEGGPDS